MRFVVVGTSGSGKTTFALALARVTGLPYFELDELHWGPNWTPRPRERFVSAVRDAAANERWVADGNYSSVRSVLWPRATHIIWLDFGRFTVLSRIVRRTLHRTLTRQPLWAGNQETLRQALFSKESIVLWSLTTFDKNRKKYVALQRATEFPHLTWYVLRSPPEAEDFLRKAG